MVPLLVLVVLLGLVFGGFRLWARRQGLVTEEPSATQSGRHVSLLTEAVAYVGAILVLAGGIAAVGQRWSDISDWGHVAVLAGAAALLLSVGFAVRAVRVAAIQRMVDVLWFLSVFGVAGAAGFAAADVYGLSGQVMLLTVGLATSAYSAALWLTRKHAAQVGAVFLGLVLTVCGTIATFGHGSAPTLAFALSLWAFGLAWMLLGWKRYLDPLWVSVPLGLVLALLAPSIAVDDHGWVYAIGIASAAAAMAASVPLHNTVLLALGTLAMFGYVTSMVIRYFHKSLGVPAALALTGAVILVLAAVSARLMREARPPKTPTAPAPPPAPTPPPPPTGPDRPNGAGTGADHDDHLPQAS